MEEQHKADPAMYPKLRERALQVRIPNLANDSIHAVVMDWNITNGTVTALAGADGSASLYLSSGGGFIGGGQKHPAIREAALQAIHIATDLLSFFEETETIDLPPQGYIYFYLTKNTGVYRAIAIEQDLKAGTDQLNGLGGAMQTIITQYRLRYSNSTPGN